MRGYGNTTHIPCTLTPHLITLKVVLPCASDQRKGAISGSTAALRGQRLVLTGRCRYYKMATEPPSLRTPYSGPRSKLLLRPSDSNLRASIRAPFAPALRVSALPAPALRVHMAERGDTACKHKLVCRLQGSLAIYTRH